MKTVKNKIMAIGFAVAVAVAFWAPEITHAADQVKGAEKLMSKPVKSLDDLSAIQPGDMMVMSCPKCKNATVHFVEPTFKATESREKVKTQHTCPGCNNTITVEGHGKAKKDVITHVCQTCGSKDAFCCVVKKK
jgi:ribosomal protein S27E